MPKDSGELLTQTRSTTVGARGVSARVRSIEDAAAAAFSFKDVFNLLALIATHTKALVELYRLIKSDLQRRPWPPDEYVDSRPTQEWPHSRGIAIYYKRWWKNVYNAARVIGLPFARRWRVVEKVAVQPVWVSLYCFVVWTCIAKKIARKKRNAYFQSRIVVWRFTGTITFWGGGNGR